jgi:threonine dehydratase
LKIEATRSYGAEITFVQNPADRAMVCDQIAAKTGAAVIPPYDHRDIILGQGTVMYEFQMQMEEEYGRQLDAVIIPVGGGGLLAGCATACIGSGTRIFGAEPVLADDCARGIHQGFRAKLDSTPTTIADGLRTEVGVLNFGIIQKHVQRIFTVTEEQIATAMRIVIEHLKVVVEPSAAVPVAVALFHKDFLKIAESDGIKTVGIVLEGGNIDTGSYEKMMPWIHLSDQTDS